MERAPAAFGLRKAVGEGEPCRGVEADAEVARVDLDVLDEAPLAVLQPVPSCRRVWRCLYQAERYLTIQSIKARSKPMSTPAFSLSIHLCRKISALSAKNSLYKAELLTS